MNPQFSVNKNRQKSVNNFLQNIIIKSAKSVIIANENQTNILHETQRHNQGENSNVEQDSRNANTGHEQEQDSPGIRNQQRDGKQLSVNG